MNKPLTSLIDHLFEHAGSGLCLLDAAGRVQRASERWLDAVEMARTDAIGRELWALFPDAGSELRALVAEARSPGEPHPVPARLLRRGGQEQGHEGELTPIALEGGVGLLLTLVNIDASRRLEARLRAAEARHERMLDGMIGGCRILDRSFRYQYVNAAFVRQTGKTAAEVLGRTIFEVNPTLAGSPICEALTRSMEERVPIRIEHELPRADGSVACFDLSVQPIDEGLFVLSVDITEQKRAEAALRASEARLQHVLDGMLEGCALLDPDLRYLYVNDAALRQSGKRAEEVLGRTLTEVHPGIEEAPVFATLARCMSERTSARIEDERRLPDGAVGWFDLSIQPQPEGLFVLSVDITEKKLAEAELRGVRDELQAIFRASPVAFAALDGEGRVKLWSAAAERLFGWSAAEVVGRSIPVIPADKEEELAAMRQRARNGEVVLGLRTARVARDGRRVPISLSTSPLLDAAGRPAGMVAVLLDLSSEEALRAALGESERRYATVFEASPVAKLLVRAGDRRVIDVNPACSKMFGVTREAVLEGGALRLTGAAQAGELDRIWSALDREGEVSRFDLHFSTEREPHGEAELSAALVTIEGEGCALVALHDVTLRRRAERALRESDQRFRDVVGTIEEVFWLTDASKGEVIYVSPGYERLWGRPCAGLYANPRQWVEAIHPADRARVLEAALTKQVNGSYDEQYRVVHPDGTIRWIRDRAYPVRDEGGRIVRVAGSAQDITGQRELEEQLRQTQKMESVGQLAGGVAHDFNNLLMVIEGGREALTDLVGQDPACAELLDEIRVGCQRAASLTHQLLAFSRREVVEQREVVLEEIIGDTEKMLRRILGEDIALSLVLAAQPSHVKVDPGSWAQVLMNLAVNARDAMPRGGRLTLQTERVTLDEASLRAHPGVPPGEYARLRVIDTGVGMPAEIRTRVFEPFFTTKAVGKGTGLGLSVVHGIVAQSGGLIEVASEPGAGTTFSVHLPLVPVGARVDAIAPAALPDSGAETILLVEDEESIRRIARRALTKAGYQVFEAQDGLEALEVAARHEGPIHLLVTDVVMPRLDGRSLAERLSARRPELLVLFTSGYTDDTVLRYDVQHAEVPFLAKPYPLTVLRRRVRELLDGRPRRDAAPRPSPASSLEG